MLSRAARPVLCSGNAMLARYVPHRIAAHSNQSCNGIQLNPYLLCEVPPLPLLPASLHYVRSKVRVQIHVELPQTAYDITRSTQVNSQYRKNHEDHEDRCLYQAYTGPKSYGRLENL